MQSPSPSSTARRAAELPATAIESCATGVAPSKSAHLDVGQTAQHQVEAELDSAIAELFAASEKAMRNGDPWGARSYVDRAYAAIASRTPEHKARLEREALERLDADPCYFAGAGERDRAAMEGRCA